MQICSWTAVLASACLMVSGVCFGQTQGGYFTQNTPNFYITTPQTGERTSVGYNSTVAATSARGRGSVTDRSTMNTYLEQTPRQRPVASRRATSDQRQVRARSTAPSQRSYYIQQVSNPAVQQSTRQASANYYTNSQGNAYSNRRQSSERQSAQAAAYSGYNGYPQQTANRAYVSNSTQQKQGFLSRLLHGHDHQNHQQHQHYYASQQKPETKRQSLKYRASKLAGTMQQGVASWYGGKWHGRKTANGERYNQESMTAAHKTLPFGTMVRVKNERNGHECVVRINNRGPFTKGRIIDLSKAAARQLNMVGSGIAKVSMEVIGRS